MSDEMVEDDFRCVTCAHADTTMSDAGEPMMECHLNPPQVWWDPERGGPSQAYPTVREGDWCSHWESTEPSISS